MNDVLKILLSLSFSGSLLIVILLLSKRFIKDRLSRQWQYYIWLVVVARLLLPFTPEPNLTGSIFGNISTFSIQDGGTALTQPASPDLQSVPSPTRQDQSKTNQAIPDTLNQYGRVGAAYINDIWIIWILVALALLIRKITVYQSFVRYVRAGQAPVTDIELMDRLALMAEQAGIRRPIELCINPLVSSPLLTGFFRPCIVLPTADITVRDFRCTVLHELMHYRRHDMFYKWLVQVTVCLHWFNPLVFLMSREINRTCEFSCDEAVICRLNPDEVRDYGMTLLDTVARSGRLREPLASATMSENKEMLKERIGAIMSFTKISKKRTITTAAVTLIFLAGATFAGAYALPESLPSPQPVEEKTDVITPEQADEMALNLTKQIWVWEWIEFFVPYMTDEGVSQLIPAAKASHWAEDRDMTTGKLLLFTQDQVDSARSRLPEKAYLKKTDIDAHALMIMASNRRLDCVDFMLPYMTDSGISAVLSLYSKNSESVYKIESPDTDTPTDADKIAKTILDNAKSWDCTGILWPYLSKDMKDTLMQKAQDAGTPITSDVLAGWKNIPSTGGSTLTAEDIDLGVEYYIKSYGWVSGLEYLIPHMSDENRLKTILSSDDNQAETPARDQSVEAQSTETSGQSDADEKALSIMENSGTWGDSIERLLPHMSSDAIEKMLIIYVDRHIFAGISTAESIKNVEQTVQVAYPYMTNEAIERVKARIKALQ